MLIRQDDPGVWLKVNEFLLEELGENEVQILTYYFLFLFRLFKFNLIMWQMYDG